MGVWQGPLTPASARRWGRMVLSWRAPSISGGSGLACAVVPPAHPPPFLETGGHPLLPPAGAAPPAPSLERQVRRSQGKRGWNPLPSLPPSTRAGTEAPPGGLGEGDGTVAKRDPARSQRGHSPVKRGHSAVIAPTAVRPRCDGLFPGGGCVPCTPFGGDERAAFSPWRVGTLLSLPPGAGAGTKGTGASFRC